MGQTAYDVIIVGAGFSGICAAIKLRQAGISNICILEKSNSVGGTWYKNTYPGAACDVPSHFYCYSFEPNPNWSRKFAPQKEILAYINHCADKYRIRQHISFGQKVEQFTFDEKTSLWRVEIKGGEVLHAHHIINGMGGLHKPAISDFENKDAFLGPTLHSARWDHTIDFADKHVAVIGSAASAIQIIPELQKISSHVDIYQRTPNYIAPRYDRDFTQAEKARFARWPFWARLYRWYLYKRMDVISYPLTKPGSKFSKKATTGIKDWIRATISDPDLQARMMPDYQIGCKRILLSDVFYDTLTKDNVTVISSGIERFSKTGIETKDGVQHPADIIVYATGFDLQGHMDSIEVIGRDGVSARGLGFDGQVAFKGAVHSDFPNYYMVTGPNTGVGTTSVVHMIEKQIGYIIQLIKAAGRTKTLSVKPAIMKAYNERIQADLAKSVWASGCQSWYIREDGKITTLYPGNAKDFTREHKRVDFSNYNISEGAFKR